MKPGTIYQKAKRINDDTNVPLKSQPPKKTEDTTHDIIKDRKRQGSGNATARVVRLTRTKRHQRYILMAMGFIMPIPNAAIQKP